MTSISPIPNYFYGFSTKGVVFSFLSGGLIGVGWKIMLSHQKLLRAPTDREEVARCGFGCGFLSFGLYTWMPPFLRQVYSVLPEDFFKHSKIAKSDLDFNVNTAGILFAYFTGTIFGAGYGALVCSPTAEITNHEPIIYRIAQTSIGAGLFLSGVFAASPGVLKAVWTRSTFLYHLA